MDKVTVVKQYSRFDNTKKDVEVIEYKKQTALQLKQNNLPAVIETDTILNGEIIRSPENTWIMPGDQIVFIPHVNSDVLRTILPLVIMAAAFVLFPGSLALTAAWSMPEIIAARMAMVIGGSLLVNAILPPPKGKTPALGNFSNSPTYSWNAKTTDNPDTPIPMIFGTMKVHGKIISSYRSNDGSKHYLNLLLSLGQGIVSNIYDFKLNGQPAYQYDNVKIEARKGDIDQTSIDGFNTTKKEYPQGITVSGTTPSTSSITFTGSGLNDMTVTGTPSVSNNYLIQIDSAATPDTFEWSKDGGTTWYATGVSILGTSQLLIDEMSVTFPATTGHTVGDNWAFTTTATPFLYTTPESDFDEVEVDISFPQGLWHSNDSGGLDNNIVDYKIEYSLDAGVTYTAITSSISAGTTIVVSGRWSAGHWDNNNPIGQWIEIAAGSSSNTDHNEGDSYFAGIPDNWWRWMTTSETVNTSTQNDYSIATSHATKSIIRTFKFNAVNAQVLLKITKITLDRNNLRYGDTMQVSAIREVYFDDFEYPYQALVGIKALATNKLAGSFDFTCLVDGLLVNVYDGANWSVQYSTNPAWICWYVLTLPVMDNTLTILGYEGIDPSRLTNSLLAFKSWADYCDETVSDGTKRSTFNGVFDTERNMWETALTICSAGRANLLYNGIQIVVLVDRPALSTHSLVNISNFREGTFSEHFLPASQKIGKLTIEYKDASNDYETKPIVFKDTSAGDTAHSVSLQPIGITNINEAKRFGLLRLYHNKYTSRSVEGGFDIDTLNYQVGDVVDLQHDVPEWGDGGKLVSATSTTVTLDKIVTLKASTTYGIKIRLDDDTLVDKVIVENDGDFSTLTVTVAFTTTPTQFAPYAVYESVTGMKPFRVAAISTDSDLTAKLTFLEYNDAVYTDTDAGILADLPTINYSEIDPLPAAINLQIDEIWTTLNDGTIGDELVISFDSVPNNIVSGYEIWYRVKQLDGTVIKDWESKITVLTTGYTMQSVLVGVIYDIAVLTVNHLGAKTKLFNAPQVSLTTLGKDANPSDVTNFVATEKDFDIVMTWDNIPDADLSEYEIKDQTGTIIFTGKALLFKYNMQAANTYTFAIRAKDTSENYSTNATTASITISAPNTVNNLTVSISGDSYVLDWDTAVATSFPVSDYQITYGASRTPIADAKTTIYSAKVDWSLDRTFYVSAVDQFGNVGVEVSASLHITAPPVTVLTITVVDNFALLKWAAVKGSLPIDFYEIRRGSVFSTATVIAQQKGNFMTDFETQDNDYTFWVVGVDTAGNYGTEISESVHISAPVGYVLNVDWIDDNSGVLTNMIVNESNNLLGCVNTTETWTDHYVNNSWTTPQNQIDAGYPIYVEPALTSGSYSQTFDYGAVLASSKITVNVTSQNIAGSPTYTVTISTRKLATDAWAASPVGTSAYVTNFQYVKIDIAITGTATDLIEISKIEVRLDSKLKHDAGETQVYAADVDGTTIYFNIPFTAVTSISVSAKGTTSSTAVYNFTSIPNPPSFEGLRFDASQVREDGVVSWQTDGY